MNNLQLPTLILNSGWQPISVASVRKCLQKVFAGKAYLLDPDSYVLYDNFDEWCNLVVRPTDRIINVAKRTQIRAPEIIIYKEYDRFPEREVKLTRRNLLIRDGFRCMYTGKRLSSKDATIDHVIPVSRGGKTSWDNVVICSSAANTKKADKTPAEAGMHLIKQPRQPAWSPIYSRYAKYTHTKTHPESWNKFVKIEWDPDTYWDVELDET